MSHFKGFNLVIYTFLEKEEGFFEFLNTCVEEGSLYSFSCSGPVYTVKSWS